MHRHYIAVLTVITVAALITTTVSSPGKIQGQQTGLSAGIVNAYPAKVGANSDSLDTLVQAATLPVTTISAGSYHTCALHITGAVKCWGDNGWGQIGNNSTIDSHIPVDVSGLSSGVVAISAGGDHSCAILTTGGTVKCWGYNLWGQLGNNSTNDSHVPVDVTGLSSGVAAISAGYVHTCAVLTTGAVNCWGYNGGGQLGDGTYIQRNTPVDVRGLTSSVTALAVGGYHTCALTSAGGVKCWGNNEFGQLGVGTQVNHWAPVDVSGLTSGVIALTAGDYQTCALTSAGGVKCWGWNTHGELGDGTYNDRLIPVDVSGLTYGVTALAAGVYHTCALTSVGGIKCWGWNDYGQIGDGTYTQRNTPVDVVW